MARTIKVLEIAPLTPAPPLNVQIPADLPIAAARDEIAAAILNHQVIVVCGETGSGKTTQLPKICLSLGGQSIGHTQPRRLAARTVAQRIADELNTPLGGLVGYKIRFSDQTRRETRIKLMTDGVLLNETQTDRDLRRYDTLIIDEAHERSLNIDFLLGYLKRLLPRRPDMKVILTSATIDPERFSKHFNDAPIIMVEGRTYPVETRYRPLLQDEREMEERVEGSNAQSPLPVPRERVRVRANLAADDDDNAPNDPPSPQPSPGVPGEGARVDADLTELEGVVEAVRELTREGRGDMLVFLPTERDIRETAEVLEGEQFNADILPLYSRLSAADQLKVFRPDGKRRRIILSTNVAETSVTVPGIHCVIDTGLARVSRYSTRTKVQRLPIEPISQASADQRKGRCGRVAPGVCIRLYGEKDFSERPRYAEPEILRTNLAAVILQMKWLRLGKIEDFPFIDPPDTRQVRDGLATLHEIGAINDADELTAVGKRLAKLPVDPRVGRMILGGQDEDCLPDVQVIAAALSTQDVRERPADKQDAADQAHAQFRDPQSDFISLLKLWTMLRDKQRELSNGQFRKWCRANFISYLRFREWSDVHAQLCDLMQVRASTSVGAAHSPKRSKSERDDPNEPFPQWLRDAVHRALLGGLLSNVAMKADTATYTGARGTKLSIWPGSALFKARPQWIVSAELVETTKLYSRTVAPVRPEWIERAAKHLVKRAYTEPHWVKQTAHVHAFERVTLWGLLLVPRRSVHYGPVDPATSRQLFIHHALVLNEFNSDQPAVLQNQQRVREIERWQEKLRRRDLLSDGQTRYEFFDAVVPPHVFSGPTFDLWTKRGAGSNWHDLELPDERLTRTGVVDELLKQFAAAIGPLSRLRDVLATQFPDVFDAGGLKLPLEYHFEPGEEFDGVTAVTPVSVLPQLSIARAEWLVPGLVRPKIDMLIRSLPKKLRTLFVPVNQAVDSVAQRLPPFGVGSFMDAVAGALWKISGEPVRRDDFQADHIPPNLLLNFRVLDAGGAPAAQGRDLGELRLKLGQQAREQVSALADPRFTRDDVRAWDFGDLPVRVEVEQHGAKLYGFPTLIEQGGQVQLRLLDAQEKAAALMPYGLRRLFMIETARELQIILRDLPGIDQLRLNYRPYGGGDEMTVDLTQLTASRAFFPVPNDVRTKDSFVSHAHAAWGRLYETSRFLGKLTADILERTRVLTALLTRTYPPLLVDNVDDMRAQLGGLVPKGFLQAIPGEKLEQLPRYLRGIEARLTKLQNAGLSRDLSGLQIVRPLQRQLTDMTHHHARRGIIDPALSEYRWLLEEFRISIFAQEVKAIVPVSAQKLEAVWKRVRTS